MKSRKNALRKCVQLSQAGNPTGVSAHGADPLGAGRPELGGQVAEAAGLPGAAAAHRGRIEEQHHRPAGQQFGQPAGDAVLVGKLEIIDDVALLDSHALKLLLGT